MSEKSQRNSLQPELEQAVRLFVASLLLEVGHPISHRMRRLSEHLKRLQHQQIEQEVEKHLKSLTEFDWESARDQLISHLNEQLKRNDHVDPKLTVKPSLISNYKSFAHGKPKVTKPAPTNQRPRKKRPPKNGK